jgi:uncharacterized protein with PQ loop repeat
MANLFIISTGATCPEIPVAVVIVAICLCLGGLVSYIPQHITLIRAGTAEGISEKSLFILSCSQGALVLNSLILNWSGWYCYSNSDCNWWKCTTGLLSFFQICVNFIAAIPVWFMYLRFKIRDSARACLYDLAYVITFLVLAVVALILSLVEKHYQNEVFFAVFARILGIGSAITGALVWLPQIAKLMRSRNTVGLSLWMFIMQSIGGVIIILFQAVLYQQNWTTWIGYVFVCVEQIAISVILIVFRFQRRGLDIIDLPSAEKDREEIAEFESLLEE